MDINTLKALVGEPYQELDEQGHYIGCFAPLYFLWADLPRYSPPVRQSDYFHSAFSRLCENFDVVDAKTLKPFDVVVFKLTFGALHVGVFLGENQVLHVQRGASTELVRLSRLSHRVVAVLRRCVLK